MEPKEKVSIAEERERTGNEKTSSTGRNNKKIGGSAWETKPCKFMQANKKGIAD